eukprot:14929896-Alexandrium_andersonii.AAC.1
MEGEPKRPREQLRQHARTELLPDCIRGVRNQATSLIRGGAFWLRLMRLSFSTALVSGTYMVSMAGRRL